MVDYAHQVDLGGLTLIAQDVVVGATAPGQQGTVDLQGSASASMRFISANVNFNAATTDTPITITLPAGVLRYRVSNVYVLNAGHTLTTATVGLFSATGGTGVAIAADQAITVANNTPNTTNNLQTLTLAAAAATTCFTLSTLYIRVGTAEGVAAGADVVIHISVLE